MFGGKGGFGNMAGMMKKMQKLQADMKKMQEELKKKTVEATVGGGVVTVVMNGEKIVERVTIDPSVINADDKDMLEDLIIAAYNEASRKVDDMMSQEMGKLTGGMNLPSGLF